MSYNPYDIDLEKLTEIATERIMDNKERMGQALFNALSIMNPGLANLIAGTDADCFYRNENILGFLSAILLGG